jgi:hypothetical protein
MALTGIQESNMRLKCQHLERIVNFSEPAPDNSKSETLETEPKIEPSIELVEEAVEESIDSEP